MDKIVFPFRVFTFRCFVYHLHPGDNCKQMGTEKLIDAWYNYALFISLVEICKLDFLDNNVSMFFISLKIQVAVSMMNIDSILSSYNHVTEEGTVLMSVTVHYLHLPLK